MSVFYLSDFSSYVVCGLRYQSKKRFTIKTQNWFHANGINLWRGNVWGVRKSDGKRVLLKRVSN